MSKIKILVYSLINEFIISLPLELSKVRVYWYNWLGNTISKKVSIGVNVRIRSYVSIGDGSSIAQNCSISGEKAGVTIGKNVMIAPNVVIVAFNHGIELNGVPMKNQKNTEDRVDIKDDVWIGANCTIGKGITIESGAIIAANSYLNKNVLPNEIFGGVPAKKIGIRS